MLFDQIVVRTIFWVHVHAELWHAALDRRVAADSDWRQVLGHRWRVGLAERLAGVDSPTLVVPALRLEVEQTPVASQRFRGLVTEGKVWRRRDVIHVVIVFQKTSNLCQCTQYMQNQSIHQSINQSISIRQLESWVTSLMIVIISSYISVCITWLLCLLTPWYILK